MAKVTCRSNCWIQVDIMAKTTKPITEEQEKLFADRYSVDFSQNAAALVSGGTDHNKSAFGTRMMKRPGVQSRITENLRIRCVEIEDKGRWILERAIENMWLAREKGDFAQANKALEIVGRHVQVQAFKDTLDVNLPEVSIRDFTGRLQEEDQEALH